MAQIFRPFPICGVVHAHWGCSVTESRGETVNGKVKWFNNAKGYGFILPESGGKDVFCHYSEIEIEGFRTLSAGQTVEFGIEEGPKGLSAKNVKPMSVA